MSMKGINGFYNNYAANNTNAAKRKETDNAKAAGAKKNGEIKQPRLSKAAQSLLEKLKKQYGNMDFMVADFENSEEARGALSRGTKEISVLFSSEELEKMASDEKYEKECIGRLDKALRMSDEINAKYGYGSAFGKDGENGEITRIGVAFNKDGTMTYFAELEKSSNQQREKIERNRAEHAEERKAAEKDGKASRKKESVPVKRTVVEASSEEELIKKLTEVDWSRIASEQTTEGGKFDFSI